MPATMAQYVLAIFIVVYLGMLLGGLPFLQLDRTGVALLGAIALIIGGAASEEQAARAIHLPTLILLFSFMVLSAQMRLGGFYTWVTRRVAARSLSPAMFLGVLIAAVAAMSAIFSNDIVCLAVAPVLVDVCARRGLNPVPYLLALAAAANVGSAATLIGNPQNMLIGETLKLSFAGYAAEALIPVLLSLCATWGIVCWRAAGRWHGGQPDDRPREELPAFDVWQASKGLSVTAALVLAFLLAPWPREIVALAGAGLLLMSRRLHSNKMLGLVDWELLILFVGLFVVNDALFRTGLAAEGMSLLAAAGISASEPAPLFLLTFLLSNLVSNVPAVMLLLPAVSGPYGGTLLALVSTFAGNLLIVGSIANIIVVDAARRRGVLIGWRTHAAVGVPVTCASLLICALWLAWRGTPQVL